MFSCIRLQKWKQCCEPKIGGETPVTSNLSSGSEWIKFSTWQCVKEVLCDIAPMDSCHLLLGWAWLRYKTLHLDERSLYLRHEGHQMKYKFMTPRQVSKDQRKLKEKTEKERIEKQLIYSEEGRENKEKEMELGKVYSSMFFLLQFVMSFYRNKRISMWMKHTNFHV